MDAGQNNPFVPDAAGQQEPPLNPFILRAAVNDNDGENLESFPLRLYHVLDSDEAQISEITSCDHGAGMDSLLTLIADSAFLIFVS